MMSTNIPWEDLQEEIAKNGEAVYGVYWDSGAPGAGADWETVYKYKGKYYLWLTFDDEHGPYDTLLEALEVSELLSVTDATVSVTCTEIPTEELVRKLTYLGDTGLTITVNEEEWQVTGDGEFMRIPE